MVIVWQSFFLGVMSTFLVSSLLLLLLVMASEKAALRHRPVPRRAFVRTR